MNGTIAPNNLNLYCSDGTSSILNDDFALQIQSQGIFMTYSIYFNFYRHILLLKGSYLLLLWETFNYKLMVQMYAPFSFNFL